MVYLYQFPRTYYVPSLSPFSVKLETWMRMANIDYEVILNTTNKTYDLFSECRNVRCDERSIKGGHTAVY
jgi:hypothetical protein